MKTVITYNGVEIVAFNLGWGAYLYEVQGQDFETMEEAKGYVDMMADMEEVT